ncbi:ketopantoate reductase family protein [Siccirubricoccus sp. G192]|uniref:ketopantoate reductase family protein n=1 Tax=Siccirubricoccus sp. G192 TaxID=2849651 RepID=UPI001C2C7EF0|nr:2-dehydropantoate 2-reductase [Siccirubricoccus sp. G192]MBV1797215.1 2-dehydropantoate 2-reductase [Siccirubricoccus sp. G192]
MRICIYGAGAIGCYLGAHLARVPDISLTMVARGATLAALRERGLRLETAGGSTEITVQATDAPATLPPQDVVFITLKAHQLSGALAGIAPLLGPETAVVPPTTGIPYWYFHRLAGPHEGRRLERLDPGGRQWAVLTPERAIGCAFWVGLDTLGPGTVRQEGTGAGFPIGEPDGTRSDRLLRLHRVMTEAGLRAPIRDDIRGEIWTKMINSLVWNPIATLTRATLGEIGTAPDVVALARAMMGEAEAVARALGATLSAPAERRIAWTLAAAGHRMSMLQDLERGRILEYGVLRDSIAAMREIAGLETPAIDAALALLALQARIAGVAPP